MATKAQTKKAGSGLPLLKQPGDIDYDRITADEVAFEDIDPTDVNFEYGELTADQIKARQVKAGNLANQFMTTADYTLIDPAEVSAEFGDINRTEIRKNAQLSSELALDTLATELQGLKNFAPAAANLKRQETALDNTFNQAERDRQLAAGDPNLRADLEAQRLRATAYAEGRVPDSIQDRAFELGIQSRSTDAAAASGFGVRSMAAAKASSLMSAEKRIALSQYGDQSLTQNIGNRANLLLAPTQYSDAGSQIKVTPTQSAGQIALGIASEANAGNITARDALQSKTQQSQFATTLEQDTRKTNVELAAQRDLNQARLDLEADTTSAGMDLEAQSRNQTANLQAATTNADNAIRTQLAGKEISSREKLANAELKFNTANANADRNFQAANANAGRALEVASSNRAVRLEVEKTNKAMIFQDQQRKAAEAAAARASAAANAAANARAAMSAASQAAALAASKEEAQKDRDFQLQQQAQALELYKEGRKESQSSQDWGTAGTIISRLPSIIAGVGSATDSISSWWSDDSSSGFDWSGGGGTGDSGFGSNWSIGDSMPDFSFAAGT